jgi:hypothetical protein
MSHDLEALRRERERLDREREAIDRRLAEAERHERRKAAELLVRELCEATRRIDALKVERTALLRRIRELDPRGGDFTYAAEDDRLALPVVRASMKQPELLDKLLAALDAAGLHVEPRAPRFRVFRGLHPVGTLQIHPKRLVLAAIGPVLDGALLDDAAALDRRYPGLLHVTWDTTRRVREGVPGRAADGRCAAGLSAGASDTGSLDAVLPLLVRALDHVAGFCEQLSTADEARLFEPVPAEGATVDASVDAPAAQDGTAAA